MRFELWILEKILGGRDCAENFRMNFAGRKRLPDVGTPKRATRSLLMRAMRSTFLRATARSLAASLAFFLCASAANAQPYPNRPIRMIVPAAPGGGIDIIARLLSQKLAQQMGVAVIVENKAGASGVIGTRELRNAEPDGYTMMMSYSGHATNPLFIKNIPYDSLKDFTPVVLAAYSPLILVVNPKVPAQNLKELIQMAKDRPGRVQFASGGTGGPFMAGLLMRHLARVDILSVPYKGNAPALNAVLAGDVTMMFDTINTSVPMIKAGRLRALAVTGPERSVLAPDVPTMIEAGLAQFEVSAWFMPMLPANVPAPIVQRLNAEFNKALNQPDIRSRLSANGVVIVGGTSKQAEAFLRAEMKKWKAVVEGEHLGPKN